MLYMENTNQMMNLTEYELLELYKTMTHLTSVRRDCEVERDDGIDLDAWLTLRLRQWYARLLQDAPVEWLPVQDVKDDVVLTADTCGVVRAVVPPQCVRPVEWRLQGWSHSVTSFLSPQDAMVRLQLNPWTRGRAERPAAIDHGDHLTLYSVKPGASLALTVARCVVRPVDGIYSFHTAALSSLPALDDDIRR